MATRETAMKIEAGQNTGFVGASCGTRPGSVSARALEPAPADWVRLEGGSRYVTAAMQTDRSLNAITASVKNGSYDPPLDTLAQKLFERAFEA
jgi:hypothetical protein